MKKSNKIKSNKIPPSQPNMRNSEFEEQMKNEKPWHDFLELGSDEANDFISKFQLNWSYRNDIAKAVITLSSALLALLVALTQSKLFANIPANLIIADMILLVLTISANLGSLWMILDVTLVHQFVMTESLTFLETHKKMIEDFGKFEPSVIQPYFFKPVDRAWVANTRAYCSASVGNGLSGRLS